MSLLAPALMVGLVTGGLGRVGDRGREAMMAFSNLALQVLHLHRQPAEVILYHVQEQIIRYKLED